MLRTLVYLCTCRVYRMVIFYLSTGELLERRTIAGEVLHTSSSMPLTSNVNAQYTEDLC